MPETSDLTVLLAGPKTTLGPLLAGLERAGARLPDRQHDDAVWRRQYGIDDPATGFAVCRHSSLDDLTRPQAPAKHWTDANGRDWTAEEWHAQFGPAGVATRAGWRVVAHWNTPACGVCAGSGKVNHPTAGLGACLHCEGTGRTNVAPPTAEQVLRAELDEIKAKLAALEGR